MPPVEGKNGKEEKPEDHNINYKSYFLVLLIKSTYIFQVVPKFKQFNT